MRKRPLFVAAICTFAYCLTAGIIVHGQNDRSAARLAALTTDLSARVSKGRVADPGFVAAAKARFAVMQKLAKSDPQAVLDNALSDSALARIPLSAKDYFERRESLTGKLEVIAECEQHDGRIHRYLKSGDQTLDLSASGQVDDNLLTGAEVEVSGIQVGETLAFNGEDLKSTDVTPTTNSLTNTTGEKRVLVILVNFQDKQTQPFTVEHARNVTFGTTSDYFYENSYGRTWLTGDVYGWYTIPVSSTVCDKNAIGTYAQQAAANAGANISAYDHIVYGFPSNACTFSGSSTIGGFPSNSWVNHFFSVSTLGHELGHGLGLFHSRSLDCGNSSVGSNCAVSEYGNVFDIMGGGAVSHMNPFQKERLGWLSNAGGPPLQTVTASGTYWIDAYETSVPNTKALKILKSIDSAGNRSWYYVEHRTPTGFDSYLSNPGYNLVNGVSIHQGSEVSGTENYLLDMTPETTSWYDAAIVIGQSFADSGANLTITTLSADNSGAWVRIEMASQACVRANPTISVTPGNTPWLLPGASFAYQVTVNNNNSGGCSGETFNLSRVAPNGFAASFSNPSLNIPNGGSANATLYVSSPATAGDGLYNIGVSASNSANSSYSASTSAAHTIVSALGVTATPGAPKYSRSQTAKVTSAVTAGGSPQAGASVTFTLTKPNGTSQKVTLETGSDGRAIFSYKFDRKRDPTGTYYVSVFASKSGYEGQAATSFLVNK